MGNAVGQMLASAVGVAISPIPLIAVVLMLATPRGRSNGSAFALGWVAAVALLTFLIVAFGGGMQTGGEPADWTYWLKLALGVLFLLLASRQWQGRPREGQEAQTPKWRQAIDRFTPGKAGGPAAALVLANPKNLVLQPEEPGTGGRRRGVDRVQRGEHGGKDARGGAHGPGRLALRAAAARRLLRRRRQGGRHPFRLEGVEWMGAHNSAIMIVLLLVLGAKYVGDALTGLSG